MLLVEPDNDLATMMQDCLRTALNANVTVVADAAAALREELTAHHDVLLVDTELPDANWVDLAREIRQNNRNPLILLAANPSTSEMIEAIRVGVMDVLSKPFDLANMTGLAGTAARRSFKRQRTQVRNRRLRKLTSRIIHERRDLRRRIDLICHDFVHAYRRLAQRVSDMELITHE
jgi:DNA-binding response OmpR family regulator